MGNSMVLYDSQKEYRKFKQMKEEIYNLVRQCHEKDYGSPADEVCDYLIYTKKIDQLRHELLNVTEEYVNNLMVENRLRSRHE